MPNLQNFSQSLCLQFHAIDLFSALPTTLSDSYTRDAAVNDCDMVDGDLVLYELERRGVLNLMPKEIELCQTVSSGPTFVVSFSVTC